MSDERSEAEQKLKKLSQWLKKGWKTMNLLTEEHLNGTRAVITEQWNQEQKLAKTQTKSNALRQRNVNAKKNSQSQAKTKKKSQNQGHGHGH